MKREPKNYKIKKIHPRFFWHKCFMCKNELKKEDMWQIESNTRGIFHVCMECAKTKEQIETYAKAGDGIPIDPNRCRYRNNSNLEIMLPKPPPTRIVKDGGNPKK